MNHSISGQFKHHCHHIAYRVYYEDTDAAGVMYYANYLKFAERARTEALRCCGVEQSEWLANQGIGFVVTRAEIDYKNGARLDDLVRVETRLYELAKVRMTMQQELFQDETLLASLKVTVACVNQNMKPVRIPQKIIEALKMMSSEE